MLKYYNIDVVFSEVPDEVTLAVNITGCPNRCPGCHSPLMQEDVGEELGRESLLEMLRRYGDGITCVCFMGGDADPEWLFGLASLVRREYPGLKVAWYSGVSRDCSSVPFGLFDYLKVGPYVEKLGPLTSPHTNQRMYRLDASGSAEDITSLFLK